MFYMLNLISCVLLHTIGPGVCCAWKRPCYTSRTCIGCASRHQLLYLLFVLNKVYWYK